MTREKLSAGARLWGLLLLTHLGGVVLIWLATPTSELLLEARLWGLLLLPALQVGLILLWLERPSQGAQESSKTSLGALVVAWWIHLLGSAGGTIFLEAVAFRQLSLQVSRLLELGGLPFLQAAAYAWWAGMVRVESFPAWINGIAAHSRLRPFWFGQLSVLLVFLLLGQLAPKTLGPLRGLFAGLLGIELLAIALLCWKSRSPERLHATLGQVFSGIWWAFLGMGFLLWGLGLLSRFSALQGLTELRLAGLWAAGFALSMQALLLLPEENPSIHSPAATRLSSLSLLMTLLLLFLALAGLLPSVFFLAVQGPAGWDFLLVGTFLSAATLLTFLLLQR